MLKKKKSDSIASNANIPKLAGLVLAVVSDKILSEGNHPGLPSALETRTLTSKSS